MPVTVNHIYTSPVADGTATSVVRPSDWNSVHAITLNLSGTDVIGAFSNGGNVSFGTNTDGYITGSAPTGGGGGVALSAGTNSTSTGTVVFANSNNITFGMNTDGVVTASYSNTTPYLTTAMASNRGSDFMGTNTALTANGVSMTANSSGLSLNFPAFLTTARASNDAVGLNTALTAGPLAWTVNSGGISLNAGSAAGTTTGFAGNLISGSMTHNTAGLNVSLNHPAWLTTAAQSSASNVSGVIAGTASNAATNQSAQLSGAVSFSNANGVSFFTTASGATSGIQATVATTYRASNDGVGLNTALTAGPLTWTVNSGGISLNAGSAAGTTTGFGGNLISGSMTHNTAGLNLSLSHPAWLTTAAQSSASNVSGVIAGSASNAATNQSVQLSGGVSFANTNGVSFYTTANGAVSGIAATVATNYQSQGAYLTTAALSDHSHGNPTLSLAGGLSGATASNSAGFTLSLTQAAAAPSPINFSAGTTTSAVSGLTFSNSNNISFGLGTGASAGVVTASFNPINIGVTDSSAAGTTGTLDGGNAQYLFFGQGALSISQSLNGSSGSLSIVGNGIGSANVAMTNLAFTANTAGLSINNVDDHFKAYSLVGNTAGTNVSTITTVGTLYLSGGPNITLSGNSNTIVVSAAAAGGAGYVNAWEPLPLLQSGSTTFAPGVGSWYIQPMQLPYAISGGRFNIMVAHGSTTSNFANTSAASYATNSSGTLSVTGSMERRMAIWSVGTGTNSTRLESIWSNNWPVSFTNVVSVSGNGALVTASVSMQLSGIQSINSLGATTQGTWSTSSNSNSAAASMASSVMSSLNTYMNRFVSSQLMIPIPFNTTLQPGLYYVGFMLNTTSGSSTSGAGMAATAIMSISNVNQYALYGNSNTAARIWGQSAATSGSAPFPGVGFYSATSAAPPATMAFSDIRTLGLQPLPYYNYVNSTI